MPYRTHNALRRRLVSEFADDPETITKVIGAKNTADLAAALGETYAVYMEILRNCGRSSDTLANNQRDKIAKAAEKRESVLLEVMRFFEIREAHGRNVIVRREGDGGLSVRFRAREEFAIEQ